MIHSMSEASIILAGGGTGGHISPGIAIAERIAQLDPRVGRRLRKAVGANRAAERSRVEGHAVDDSRILEEQRHQVGVREPAAEAAPGVELGLREALRAASRDFVACDRVQQRRRPDARWALVVGQCGNVQARHQRSPRVGSSAVPSDRTHSSTSDSLNFQRRPILCAGR